MKTLNELTVGEEVEFVITGMIPQYKGIVKALDSHHGRPEIQVSHRRGENGVWIPEADWPTLKDGDYILLEA
jgi:hypothetical protein